MIGTGRKSRYLLAVGAVSALALSIGVAQQPAPAPFNERDVKPEANIQDRSDIWVLDFRFKDPRLVTVDIPARGRKVVWYLWYQIINNTGEPRLFIPDFELVTHDRPGLYRDQVLPKAQEAIRRLEDPTGRLDIKNSVTVASEPIPPSKPDAYPRTITGVAMWDDVNPDSNQYSIFVGGLSNGHTEDDNKVVRRKTLQLNFRRMGDRFNMDSREIKFVPPATWLYRATNYNADFQPKPVQEKEDAAQALNPMLPPPPAPR